MKKNKVNLNKLSLNKDVITSLKPQEMQHLWGGQEDSSATVRCPFTMNCTRGLVCETTKVTFSIRFVCVVGESPE